MNDPLSRIEDKLDRVAESLAGLHGRMDATDGAVKGLQEEVKPIRDHVQRLKGMGAIVAFALAVLEMLHLWG